MTLRCLLPLTVLAVLSTADFGSELRAQVGVARPQAQQVHIRTNWNQPAQPPNPTYWTYMPKPFHGVCDWCSDPNCPGRKGIWTIPTVRWLLDPDYYKLAPDYGWAPPGKQAVRWNPVTYRRYHPNQFFGMRKGGLKSSYPVIAQPTDTTQLGYYYQQVPQWQPRPGMIPPPPNPRQWHYRPGMVQADGTRDVWLRTREVYIRADQLPPQAAPQQHQPQAVPAPKENAPPAPPANNAAFNGGFGIQQGGL